MKKSQKKGRSVEGKTESSKSCSTAEKETHYIIDVPRSFVEFCHKNSDSPTRKLKLAEILERLD